MGQARIRQTGLPCGNCVTTRGQIGNCSVATAIRGIAFTLEEEGNLGITDVTGKILQSLDVERVTRRFYDRFREELAAFQKFIDGFTAQGDRDWYALPDAQPSDVRLLHPETGLFGRR